MTGELLSIVSVLLNDVRLKKEKQGYRLLSHSLKLIHPLLFLLVSRLVETERKS